MAFRFDATKIRPIFKTRFKSVNQLARAAGVKYHTTQRALSGRRFHFKSDAIKIADALGINVTDYLI